MAGRRPLLAVSAFLVWAFAAAPAFPAQQDAGPAGKKANSEQFLRLVRSDQKVPVAMESAIVRYAPRGRAGGGPTVDLIAAVHIAEKGYYQVLNREFAKYDAVLYELVAPEGTRIRKGEESGSLVSMIQRGMKGLLDLQFQLDEIDYTRPNLVHADMSPEQFAQSMSDRGESFWTMFARMMGYAMAKQGQNGGAPSDLDLLLALTDKNRSLKLKRLLAEQLQDMDGSMMAIEGPNGSTLISERNKAALEVLRRELAAGKRKIAIFYGAGHMPDFQQRLESDFGLAPVSTRWLVAWDMKDPEPRRPKPEAVPAAGAEAPSPGGQ
jgi:hypothetical protein